MTDDNNKTKPLNPPRRALDHYKILKQEITVRQPDIAPVALPALIPAPAPAPRKRKELWELHATAYQYEDALDEDGGFTPETLIDLVFKPKGSAGYFRPQESQLILAHMDGILRDMEIEYQKILAEEAEAKKQQEDHSWK